MKPGEDHQTGRITAPRMVAAIVGLVLVCATWAALGRPSRDLIVRHRDGSQGDSVPVTFVIAPGAAGVDGGVPGVVVAHGFASARQTMMGYAWKLAYAGYGVALLDFGGHGANPQRMDPSRETLQANLDVAVDYLLAQPEVDPERIAIAGHSMGSGAAIQAGIRRPDLFDAVVAISPTGGPVSDSLPRNLMLQAGSWERGFAVNARRLLDAAGGESAGQDAFASGRARGILIIPRVEHITILFSRGSQEGLLGWIRGTFGPSPGDTGIEYRDRRGLYALFNVLGWIFVAIGLGPALRRLVPDAPDRGEPARTVLRSPWWWIGMLGSPFLATGLLAIVARIGPITDLGGMLVVGSVLVWFLAAGAAWLAVGFRPGLPSPRTVLLGVGLFALCWVGVGLPAGQLVLRWVLVPARLARWPLAAVALVPWFLAAGCAQQRAGFWQRVGLAAAQSIAVVAALVVAGVTIPGLYIVVLAIPVLPLLLAATATFGGVVRDPWAFAVGNALFVGWALVAAFPLAG